MSPKLIRQEDLEMIILKRQLRHKKSDPMLLKQREIKEGDWFLMDELNGYKEYYVVEVLTDEFVRISRE